MNEEVADERVTQAVNYVSSINAWQWQRRFQRYCSIGIAEISAVREERREPAASEEKWARWLQRLLQPAGTGACHIRERENDSWNLLKWQFPAASTPATKGKRSLTASEESLWRGERERGRKKKKQNQQKTLFNSGVFKSALVCFLGRGAERLAPILGRWPSCTNAGVGPFHAVAKLMAQ